MVLNLLEPRVAQSLCIVKVHEFMCKGVVGNERTGLRQHSMQIWRRVCPDSSLHWTLDSRVNYRLILPVGRWDYILPDVPETIWNAGYILSYVRDSFEKW